MIIWRSSSLLSVSSLANATSGPFACCCCRCCLFMLVPKGVPPVARSTETGESSGESSSSSFVSSFFSLSKSLRPKFRRGGPKRSKPEHVLFLAKSPSPSPIQRICLVAGPGRFVRRKRISYGTTISTLSVGQFARSERAPLKLAGKRRFEGIPKVKTTPCTSILQT